ncbi:hypothetical protein Poli38472_002333 [Pythium oligandrum]|uniref:Calmodulin n=1 Tax=Pythium oligandrum TaxID=41045 RepID=A0A8K1FL20_PYTOL|nr:hypothetical protein Poli38472_002333 [Pythium oligandrum]|eukprot:TMW63392.1 hypothetical protein Poli38472_002333 [Pythium oligandrum]
MASKYAKPLQIPGDFPDVLRNFTREVLRLQGKVETKEQVYEFGVQHFQELLVKRDGAGAKNAASAAGHGGAQPQYMKASEEELYATLMGAFEQLDPEQTGVVTADGYKQVLAFFAEQFQLSAVEIKALSAEADENDQGQIAYAGFAPLASQAIAQLRASRPHRIQRAEIWSKKEVEVFLHGMMQDEIEGLLREIFQRADTEDNGSLSRIEFMDALRDADLGLTRREVNILMAEAPVDEQDPMRVVYADFVPICFQVLRDVFTHGVVELPNDQDGLTQYLIEVFVSGDSEATGLLPVMELTKLFRAADIGLTRLQIITLMAEAQEDKSGFVNYEKFAGHVAGMALVLASFDSQQTFATYLQKYRKTSEYYTILDMNQHSFEQTLSRALEALDESHRGLLNRQDVVEAIRNTFQDITQRQLRCLLALADVDEMGDVEYNLITHSAFQALQKLQEYDMMVMES